MKSAHTKSSTYIYTNTCTPPILYRYIYIYI